MDDIYGSLLNLNTNPVIRISIFDVYIIIRFNDSIWITEHEEFRENIFSESDLIYPRFAPKEFIID